MNYWFDASDRLDEVDDSWWEFAKANDAADLSPENVHGLPLSKFINDPSTVVIWSRLFERARQGFASEFSLRCDGPDRRRHLALRVSRDGDRVKVESGLVFEEIRDPIRLLQPRRSSSGKPINACSWCKKLKRGEEWVEVEAFIEEAKLFDDGRLPDIIHGICPACKAEIRGLKETRPES